MIKNTDIRIGNWVYDGEMKRNCVIAEIRGESVLLDPSPYAGTKLSWLMPIELSPEVLEAVGFEWDNDTNEYANYVIKANIRLHAADDYNVVWVTGDAFECDLCTVKYLHEFQNLIYSLCKKELIYQPKTH